MKGTRLWQSSRLDSYETQALTHIQSTYTSPQTRNQKQTIGVMLAGYFSFLHCGCGLPIISIHGGWLFQKWQRMSTDCCQTPCFFYLTLSPVKDLHLWQRWSTQTSSLLKILVPTSPSPFSTLQVFQKCTVKDVGVKNLVEPTTRIEPQIRELRSGALLPLKEKKVKYTSPCGYPANCLPLPTVWYNRWLCLNPSTTLHPCFGSRETCNSCLQKTPFLAASISFPLVILLDITASIFQD